jgi:L-threonylcarbamoyladenylate synthase
MPTVQLNPERPDPSVLARAGAIVRSGGLVAFPTETVYGLGANALDEGAIRRVFAAKGRPAFNPLIAHVGDLSAAREISALSLPGHPRRRCSRRTCSAAASPSIPRR